MIISQTPLRISFVGGGTDLREFWKITDGKVLSTTIDKYIYVIVKERFDDLIVLNYTQREIVRRVDDIKHELIREAMKKAGLEGGIEITTLADIPSQGSGLGSSSSLIVGLLNVFYQYLGQQVTAKQLAEEACEIEIDILGRPIGKQDQYIAAYGGMREITFHTDGSTTVEKIDLDNDDLRVFGSNILLFYTNITRKSSTILYEQKKVTSDKMDVLVQMRDQVSDFKDILESRKDLDRVGIILNTAWHLKKQLTQKISMPIIDDMYEIAINAGALGGKLAGAGGGGFLLLYVPRENQNKIRASLKKFREFPFMLEPDGSKIIFNMRRR